MSTKNIIMRFPLDTVGIFDALTPAELPVILSVCLVGNNIVILITLKIIQNILINPMKLDTPTSLLNTYQIYYCLLDVTLTLCMRRLSLASHSQLPTKLVYRNHQIKYKDFFSLWKPPFELGMRFLPDKYEAVYWILIQSIRLTHLNLSAILICIFSVGNSRALLFGWLRWSSVVTWIYSLAVDQCLSLKYFDDMLCLFATVHREGPGANWSEATTHT